MEILYKEDKITKRVKIMYLEPNSAADELLLKRILEAFRTGKFSIVHRHEDGDLRKMTYTATEANISEDEEDED